MFSGLEQLEGVNLALYESIKLRDPSTARHSYFVGLLGLSLATTLSLDNSKDYFVGGIIHDVGKLSMPDWILKGTGKLADHEIPLLHYHVLDGKKLLDRLGFDQFFLDVALYHHERVDGSGYFGLKQHEIPLCAKVMGIVDSFEAIYTGRSYQEGTDHLDTALETLTRNPSLYDPYLLKKFCHMVSTNKEIIEMQYRKTS